MIYPEIAIAARWWADALERPGLQDNGDATQSLFASWASCTAVQANGGKTFRDDDERATFIFSLELALMDLVSTSWDRAQTDQDWGSYMRSVGVDYGPDRVLYSALDALSLTPQRAAMFSLLWPIKTRMSIDPGRVSVRHGYGAEPRQLYPEVKP